MAVEPTATANEWHPPTDFQSVSEIPGVETELRYATTNNFTGQVLYQNLHQAYLHKKAFEKFAKANEILKKEHPNLHFVVFDALRPRSVQRELFAKVKGTEKEIYVANPDRGSVHNYGFALDLSLKEKDKEIDMGTPYDDFSKKAQPKLEKEFLKKGELTEKQIENRRILKSVMERAGFKQIPVEWWHFDALPVTEVKKNYKIVE